MQRFILTGNIITAGQVLVEADTIAEAILKAEKGDFLLVEAQKKPFGFAYNPFDQAIDKKLVEFFVECVRFEKKQEKL